MQAKRRFVFKGAALAALVFCVDGVELALSPRQARARDVPLQVLTPLEQATLEALGETILPGARAAGLAASVDHQLAGDPGDALLIARILNVPPPFAPFYRAGLAALDSAAHVAGKQPFAARLQADRAALVRSMQRGAPPGWPAAGQKSAAGAAVLRHQPP